MISSFIYISYLKPSPDPRPQKENKLDGSMILILSQQIIMQKRDNVFYLLAYIFGQRRGSGLF